MSPAYTFVPCGNRCVRNGSAHCGHADGKYATPNILSYCIDCNGTIFCVYLQYDNPSSEPKISGEYEYYRHL